MPTHVDANAHDQYHVREVIVMDLPSVVQIDQATWGDEAWTIENFVDSFEDPFHTFWVLESKTTSDQILGYGIQRLIKGNAHISSLCRHPNHRGRGLGGVLLRHMINYTRSLNLPTIQLEVGVSNTHAYNLYTKHGFVITELLKQYYSQTEDAYLMRLTLIE